MNFIKKKQIKLQKRKKTAKKGDSGKVLIIGGSRDYVGAVALAGLAALRSGVDWVTIAAPEKAAYSINSLSADLVTYKIKGDYFSVYHSKEIMELIKKYDTILIGNGISLKSRHFVKNIVKKINMPLVVDADAIKALSSSDLKNSIITPHIRELSSFLNNSKIKKGVIWEIISNHKIGDKRSLIRNSQILKRILKRFLENNNILLLKGHIDTIISKDKIYFNKTGNPGMAKAGTGDVLAGLTVGFLAQTNNLLQSAVNAAYFNGLIGYILLKKHKGYTYLASDMVEEIKRIK